MQELLAPKLMFRHSTAPEEKARKRKGGRKEG
jgi:hypothetical protein